MPLEITQFAELGYDRSGRVAQVADLPFVKSESVAIAAASAKVATMTGGACMVRFLADEACRVSVGTGATATSMKLLPNVPEYFGVPDGADIYAKTA